MSIPYRPEIDGLRAIAVGSVVLYHADFLVGDRQVLSGGFLGVDIFFVISGFLITSILLREHRETRRISVLRFYERRVRRIVPALFLVLGALFVFAWFLMSPKAIAEYAG